MTPINQPHTTHHLHAPIDWEEEKHGKCDVLPITLSEGVFYSYWKPSFKERLQILFGKPIRLCVANSSQPPVMLDTED